MSAFKADSAADFSASARLASGTVPVGAVSPAGAARLQHGPTGAVHVAFAVGPGELDAWRDRLAKHGVELEQDHDWQRGGARSFYVRDPAGNSVELVEGDLWPR